MSETATLPLSDKQLRESKPPDTWDNTMRIQLLDCPRKLYYFLRGYDYADKPVYFTWGSAWHEILNTWYSFSGDQGPEARATDYEVRTTCAKEALQAGIDYWHKEGGTNDKVNTLENLILSWNKYLETYPVEPWSLIPGGGEAGWIWPMPGASFLIQDYSLGGSIDGRIHWPVYGNLILENKTAGTWLSDTYIGQYDFSPQITGYIWYETNLSGEDCFGALVNMACKQTAKAGKTPKFARTLQKRSRYELDQFIESFQYDLLRFEIFWQAWKWPKTCNPINCAGGIGKSPCVFRPLCVTDADFTQLDPLSSPSIGVRESKWEPWNREGDQL